MNKKVVIIFSSLDYEPQHALPAGHSIDIEMGLLFEEVLSGQKNKIHKWINNSWNAGHEVLAHCYYDQLGEDEVDFYLKKTAQDLGLNKSKKTPAQAENFFNMRDYLRAQYSV
jgi:hypothetical protein